MAAALLAGELLGADGVLMRRAICTKRASPSALMVAWGVALRVSALPQATPVRLRPKSKARKV